MSLFQPIETNVKSPLVRSSYDLKKKHIENVFWNHKNKETDLGQNKVEILK